MLSIKRRQGPYAHGKALELGHPETGWSGWGELGPILLRSAGIVGIAGVIMVIAAGDALFTDPERRPRADGPAFVAPASEVPSARPKQQNVTVVAVARPADEEKQVAAAAPAEVEKPAPALPPQRRVASIAPFTPVTESDAVVRSRFGDFDPQAFLRLSAPARHGTAAAAATAAPADQQPRVPVAAVETSDPVSARPPALDEALAPAAAEEAMRVAGFAARIPVPRPDPPPVRRARVKRHSDWPDTSPPDCGSKHAYWHFVDRNAGTKEWYCR